MKIDLQILAGTLCGALYTRAGSLQQDIWLSRLSPTANLNIERLVTEHNRIIKLIHYLSRPADDLELSIRADISGALVRGYGDEKNSGKALDTDLIFAMTDELLKLIGVKDV